MATLPEQLFPNARDAKAALSGLLLIAGHWELCHQIAQDIPSREGSYWHAIAHRMEPDSSNSCYWFRRVGEHPIFPALHRNAGALLRSANSAWYLKTVWDPKLFIDWCDQARAFSDEGKQDLAQQIQRAECDLLLAWSALKTKDFYGICSPIALGELE